MRILFLSRCPPAPLYLGDRLILYHLSRELSARGHALDLIALNDRDETPDDRALYVPFFQAATILPEQRRSSIDYLRRLASRHFPRRADEAWSPDLWRAAEDALQAGNYDVVHLFGGIHVYELAELVRPYPTVITPYESFSLYLERQTAAAPRSPALRVRLAMARSYERFMFAPFGRTVVVSERDRDALLELNPALPVEVVPNGVDLTRFPRSETPRQPNTILFTGNFEYAPNADAARLLARDILPAVQAQRPNAQLWLVGNAPPPDIRTLATPSVTVTGRVPDVLPYLQQAAVYASPLRFGAGIKNKVLEALAAGCPLIGTPLSFDGIAIEDGETAITATLDTFPNAILGLLEDSALRTRLAEGGRAMIESRYTWAQVAQQYETIYADVRRA